MKQYIDLVNRILDDGEYREDRTGIGCYSVFGGRIDFDLRGMKLPLVSVKETRWRTAFLEMLWFLRGESTTKFLTDNGCKLWEPWAKAGEVGPIYGVQWRHWPLGKDAPLEVDQIAQLIEDLSSNPKSRRHIVTAWNVADLPHMALPPCHRSFQCYVSNSGELDLTVDQRSWDVALGAPFNIAQYALLAHLLARATGLSARTLAFHYGDAHLYANQVEPMREVVQREPSWSEPVLVINTDNTNIDGYTIDDFTVQGYNPHGFVPMTVAV